MIGKLTFPILAIGAILSGPVQAEEDLIFVTGLRPVSPEDATASITLLDKDQLEIRNTPYIADQLRAAPGVGVSRTGGVGGLTQVRLRGAEANHTLVLLNGFEVSDPATGETDFGLWSGVDAGRIEILRGEQSTFYGSDAVGGVINVLTDERSGLSGLVEAGSEESIRANGAYGIERENSRFTLMGSAFTTDGIDTSGSGGERDGSSAYSAIATATADIGNSWSLEGLLRYSSDETDTDADADFDGRPDDTDNVTESDSLTLGASLQGDAAGLNHRLRGSFTRVIRENARGGAFVDETTGERIKISYSPSKQFSVSDATIRLSGLVDLDAEEFERVSDDVLFGDPNQQQSFDTIGTAAEIRIVDGRVAVSASARHDNNDGRFEDATTWRVGAAYALSATTRLRASAGTGVKNPTFTELFGFFPASFVGNPDLKPEKSTSYEIGLDQQMGAVSVALTYFSAELEDEIVTVFNPDFTSSADNRQGDSERHGVEIGASWQASDAVSVYASFSDITSTDDQGMDEIRVPAQTASLGVNWASVRRDGLSAGLAVDYVGEQQDLFFTFPAQAVTLDAYSLVSASLNYPLTDSLSLTVRGRNLLDEEVTDVFGFEQPGAGVFIGLRLR